LRAEICHFACPDQVLEALQKGASHDALVCCAGYVLGEYGRLVPEVPSHVQFALLHERFITVSNETKVWDMHLLPPFMCLLPAIGQCMVQGMTVVCWRVHVFAASALLHSLRHRLVLFII
jgi:hypothetical protein